LSPRDLAARKTLALFGRAEPRDFANVYELAGRFRRDRLLAWAAGDDPGFDLRVFGEMLAALTGRMMTISPLVAATSGRYVTSS
jgi:hypothetical protein